MAGHEQLEPQLNFVTDSDSQLHLQLAFRGFSRLDPRIMGLRLLRRILCGGGSSRLHISLRERLGIVYSVDASIAAYEETGAFAIELSTSPENLEKAVQEVLSETLALSFGAIPLEEFERVRKSYFFDLEYSRDSTYEMQVRYGWGELMGMVRSIEDDYAEAAALDVAALQSTEVGGPGRLYRPSTRPYIGLCELEYPLHDRTITVTQCGRICIGRRKINLSQVFAGQNIGIKEIAEKIWLVSFMHYDLGFFDHETGRVKCAPNLFSAKLSTMCPV